MRHLREVKSVFACILTISIFWLIYQLISQNSISILERLP